MEWGRFLDKNVLRKWRHCSHATNDIDLFNSSKIIGIMLKNEYLIKSIFNMNLLTNTKISHASSQTREKKKKQNLLKMKRDTVFINLLRHVVDFDLRKSH